MEAYSRTLGMSHAVWLTVPSESLVQAPVQVLVCVGCFINDPCQNAIVDHSEDRAYRLDVAK